MNTRSVLLMMLVSSVATGQSQTNALQGEWSNRDPEGGLTRLAISRDDEGTRIQAWGKCQPADCDWGKVELKLLRELDPGASGQRGLARWDLKFKDTYLTLRLDDEMLVAETFDCFKDKSGRADYHSVHFLKRQSPDPVSSPGGPDAPRDGASAATFLEVLSVDPPSAGTLKAGERVNVRVGYQRAGEGKVRIWVQPFTKGRYTPDGFYAPSAALPNGPGEVQRFVGVNSTAVVDKLQVRMIDDETKKELAKISHAVDLKWEGTVPKPETVAPVGKPFPGLTFTSLQGQDIDLATMKGKVVLVDFWATWCGPCVKEVPELVAAYEKYHGDGLEIVGISLDNKKGALQGYIRNHHMPWPQYFDGKGWKNEIAQKFAVRSIPCSYLIDRKGVVRHISLRGKQLTAAIAALLKE